MVSTLNLDRRMIVVVAVAVLMLAAIGLGPGLPFVGDWFKPKNATIENPLIPPPPPLPPPSPAPEVVKPPVIPVPLGPDGKPIAPMPETPAPPKPAPPPPAPEPVHEFNVTAQRFSYAPSTLTVKKGEKVRVNVHSTDVTHGFLIPEFGVEASVPPGQTVSVEFKPDRAGTFTFRCSVYCGGGHGDMTGTLIVTG